MIEPDKVIRNIIIEEMGIDPDRIVVYDQDWKPPTDKELYIMIAGPASSKIISSVNKFIPGIGILPDKEVKYIVSQEVYNVEITSKNTSAKLRRFEINAAMISTFSVQQQEENEMSIFRASQNMDLSFIEGGSSLHRYRIPVIINSMKTYEKEITTFNSFQEPQEVIDA